MDEPSHIHSLSCLSSCLSVVMSLTHGSPIGAIPECFLIASVRDDVVNDRGRQHAVLAGELIVWCAAIGIRCQVFASLPLPPLRPVERYTCTLGGGEGLMRMGNARP